MSASAGTCPAVRDYLTAKVFFEGASSPIRSNSPRHEETGVYSIVDDQAAVLNASGFVDGGAGGLEQIEGLGLGQFSLSIRDHGGPVNFPVSGPRAEGEVHPGS